MMNDEQRGEEGGMQSEGSQRWRGNEARMRVISFQEVRNKAAGRGLVTSVVCVCVYTCVCVYLLRQVGEDLSADSIQSLHNLSLSKGRSILVRNKTLP